MIELRTLEDLEFEHEWTEEKKPFSVWSDDLRELAKQYVEHIQTAIKEDGEGMPDLLCPFDHVIDWKGHATSVMQFIKKFFNLED